MRDLLSIPAPTSFARPPANKRSPWTAVPLRTPGALCGGAARKASTSAAARLPESIAALIVIIASCAASPAKLSLPSHSGWRYTARASGASSAETVEYPPRIYGSLAQSVTEEWHNAPRKAARLDPGSMAASWPRKPSTTSACFSAPSASAKLPVANPCTTAPSRPRWRGRIQISGTGHPAQMSECSGAPGASRHGRPGPANTRQIFTAPPIAIERIAAIFAAGSGGEKPTQGARTSSGSGTATTTAFTITRPPSSPTTIKASVLPSSPTTTKLGVVSPHSVLSRHPRSIRATGQRVLASTPSASHSHSWLSAGLGLGFGLGSQLGGSSRVLTSGAQPEVAFAVSEPPPLESRHRRQRHAPEGCAGAQGVGVACLRERQHLGRNVLAQVVLQAGPVVGGHGQLTQPSEDFVEPPEAAVARVVPQAWTLLAQPVERVPAVRRRLLVRAAVTMRRREDPDRR
eukprot:scaffold33805_cov63-Phaeocystis_antarctica.AAC.4